MVTLPLLPETPDPKESPARDPTVSAVRNSNSPMWLSFENCAPGKVDPPVPLICTDRSAARAAGSCVTVEWVAETWGEGEGLGKTDEERRERLRRDTCPGFISDGYGRVTWTNGPFRRMVGEEGVRLVMKEEGGVMKRAVLLAYTSFTCRVRVEYTCGNKRSTLTVPCDVWRMDCGGFVWRLDVNAALSLSLGW